MSTFAAAVVGEANPYGRDEYALYHMPANSAGDRLCRIVFGVWPVTYLHSFRRANLFTSPPLRWDNAQAQARAAALRDEYSYLLIPAVIVLGKRVAHAFNINDQVPFMRREKRDLVVVGLPHPSGRNHAWNDQEMVERCRVMLRRAIPAVDFGERERT